MGHLLTMAVVRHEQNISIQFCYWFVRRGFGLTLSMMNLFLKDCKELLTTCSGATITAWWIQARGPSIHLLLREAGRWWLLKRIERTPSRGTVGPRFVVLLWTPWSIPTEEASPAYWNGFPPWREAQACSVWPVGIWVKVLLGDRNWRERSSPSANGGVAMPCLIMSMLKGCEKPVVVRSP